MYFENRNNNMYFIIFESDDRLLRSGFLAVEIQLPGNCQPLKMLQICKYCGIYELEEIIERQETTEQIKRAVL